MTTYSSKANAKRAAKSRGVNLDTVEFIQDETSNWIWQDLPVTEDDQKLVDKCGHSHCPECDIHLDNGLIGFDDVVESLVSVKRAFEQQKHEWSCMACDAEWGNPVKIGDYKTKPVQKVAAPEKGEKKPTKKIERRFSSTVENPCGLVWDTCEEMKGSRRKDVLAKCVERGVAFNTARTQYQLWSAAVKAS